MGVNQIRSQLVQNLAKTITDAFESKHSLSPSQSPDHVKQAIDETINALDKGSIRVAEKMQGKWICHAWIKQAILLYFKTRTNTPMSGFNQFFDKVPLKFQHASAEELEQSQVRIVPPASVRRGAYIGPNTVLMPSYVNIGAFVDSGCMIDTWATVGSCAQIGKNVHLSGGAGIGGVLEPLQANPTIIEDNCFIGARSEIVEGVVVEQNSVISMGVFISQSTPIYNRATDEITYGRIPAGSVVIPGALPSKNGKYSTSAAIIVKSVDEKTRQKTSINELLRNHHA